MSQVDDRKLQSCAAASSEREQGNESGQKVIVRAYDMGWRGKITQSFSIAFRAGTGERDDRAWRPNASGTQANKYFVGASDCA